MMKSADPKIILHWKKYLLITIILLVSIGCDQATKSIAQQSLKGIPTIRYFYDTIRLQYAENTGGFLSLGSQLPEAIKLWLMRIIPSIGLIFILVFTVISDRLTRIDTILLALLIGGGLSNMIDRIFNNGYVVDFLNIGIGPVRTGIFNLADVLIMIGGIGLVLLNLIKRPKSANTT